MSQTSSISGKQQILADYLRVQVANGNEYFKSKSIATEVGLSSKEVGVNLGKLAEKIDTLKIEKWAQRSKATTWRVSRVEE